MKFKIHVEQVVNTATLYHEDFENRDYILGDHYYEAESEDEALDDFHSSVAIACLDDFDITCTQIPNSIQFVKGEYSD